MQARHVRYLATHHAVVRWSERVEPNDVSSFGPEFRRTKRRVEEAPHSAIRLSARIARRHWAKRMHSGPQKTNVHDREIEYLAHPKALLVCSRDRIVTVLAMSEDDFASVIVLVMIGVWIGRDDFAE